MLGGNRTPQYQGVLAALAGSPIRKAPTPVTNLLSIAGVNAIGGPVSTIRRERQVPT